jgi:hypothetical protein
MQRNPIYSIVYLSLGLFKPIATEKSLDMGLKIL